MFDLVVPPSDTDAEWRLVGACFLDHDTFDRVQESIEPGAFYSEINRAIWAALAVMRSKGVIFDPISLHDEMTQQGTYGLFRGQRNIGSLMEVAPEIDDVDDFVEVVRDKHARRQAAEIGRELVRSAYDNREEVLDFAAKAEAGIQFLGADTMNPEGPAPTAPLIDRWEPFPVAALPEPLRSFVAEAARAIGCDPSYIALPVLSIGGAAAGNKVRLEARYGYRVSPVLWTAIIGESGTSKSPALRAAMAPLHARQRAARAVYDLEVIDYKVRKHLYDKQLAKWKRDPGGEPPDEPAMPRPVRCYTSDTTVEALIPILQDNHNGTLMAADELATWFGSFGKYSSSSKGSDAAQWLSMYDAGAVIVDRKHGIPPTLSVDSAAVCILGGIQPEVFRRALGAEHRESGLAARLLTCTPPRIKRAWTEEIIDPETEQRYASCINSMHDFRFEGDTNDAMPHIFTIDREAKSAYISFINEHGVEEMRMGGDLLAAWSKLANIPLRLALIFHMVRLATGDQTIANPDEVDAASMYDALELTRWFKHEARRTYGVLSESESDRDQRYLVEWIARQGGAVTERDLQRGPRQYRGSDGEAEAALSALVKVGLAFWESTPATSKGGWHARRCVLATATLDQ